MNPQTFGLKYNTGKIAPVQCVKNDTLKDLNIKDTCFVLMLMYEGTAHFEVHGKTFEAMAPCFVCFDESESPKLLKKRGLKCDSVYFSPTFLNVNMTFSRVHSGNYEQLAEVHDLFLLKPFTDPNRYVVPIFDECLGNMQRLFALLEDELREQPDWYWSCRSRSYFMEMILLLERTYGWVGQNNSEGRANKILNPHLKNAVIYIENHYRNVLTLDDLVKAASLNRSSLTQLFKNELEMTPIEYLWHHRMNVAKKLLEYTNLPVKDIVNRCGFKTVQHFSRRFEESFGCNPTAFRTAVVSNRIKSLGL
ncbi:MAG: helix-turn-helix transcriptional regulator [Clostridia bacterium]|nr:helix-turn-helix transcriptional regulator [Clostridia bacterium]